MTLPRALIFDVDGTLAETEELHRAAFNATFADAGLGWRWDQPSYRRLLKVTGGKERMRAWYDERGEAGPDPASIARLHQAKTAHYGRLLSAGALHLRPGVAVLIARARAEGVALAVATTTSPANVEALCLACWGKPATDLFDVIAAGDEVAAKKPAPDVYLLALERLGVSPQEALAFEDSRNGLCSALAAGLPVVITPSLYTAGEDFSGAAAVLPTLVGFWPSLGSADLGQS